MSLSRCQRHLSIQSFSVRACDFRRTLNFDASLTCSVQIKKQAQAQCPSSWFGPPRPLLLIMLNTSRPLRRKECFFRDIKGSQVVIPDLYALFSGWIFNINSNYKTVKTKTDIWLERCTFHRLPTVFTLSLIAHAHSAGLKVTLFATACKSPISPGSQHVFIPTLWRKSAS